MATDTRLCEAHTLLGYACPGHAIVTLNERSLCFWHVARASADAIPQAHWVAAATYPQQQEARP